MAFDQAEFITGATRIDNCPEPTLPEICMAGRSNVGKSSLINTLTGHKNLARTSNTPGKTQQMNYYRIDNEFFLVDLPGFGYAKVSKKERARWGEEIRIYLLKRQTLSIILHLVDARHEPTALDQEFFFWMGTHQKPFSVVLTKADKISGNKLVQSVRRVETLLDQMNIEVPVLPCSSETGKGVTDVQSLILDFAKEPIT
ncbi:MAG: ribosome biogenesis GTP-binding protein YihA/YsxC [Balneolaceae bacterium]